MRSICVFFVVEIAYLQENKRIELIQFKSKSLKVQKQTKVSRQRKKISVAKMINELELDIKLTYLFQL